MPDEHVHFRFGTRLPSRFAAHTVHNFVAVLSAELAIAQGEGRALGQGGADRPTARFLMTAACNGVHCHVELFDTLSPPVQIALMAGEV